MCSPVLKPLFRPYLNVYQLTAASMVTELLPNLCKMWYKWYIFEFHSPVPEYILLGQAVSTNNQSSDQIIYQIIPLKCSRKPPTSQTWPWCPLSYPNGCLGNSGMCWCLSVRSSHACNNERERNISALIEFKLMSQINEAKITFAPPVNWQFSALSLANDKCKNLILKSYIDDCLHLNVFNLNILRDWWIRLTKCWVMLTQIPES